MRRFAPLSVDQTALLPALRLVEASVVAPVLLVHLDDVAVVLGRLGPSVPSAT